MLTLDEYRDRRPLPKREPNPRQAEAILREAARMDVLTGDPDWDYFLAYLEAAVKAAQRVLDSEVAKLRSPLLVDDLAIRALKASITRIEARIGAFNEVIELPKLIKERGALVKPQIAEMKQGA
jgi:hypothetical protein